MFVIGEVQYLDQRRGRAPACPAPTSSGAWYNSNQFADQRYANDGLPLADPASNGVPLLRTNNWSMYAVADQMVWRKPGTKDQGIGVFARVTGAATTAIWSTRLVNVGVTWKGIIPGREDDTAGDRHRLCAHRRHARAGSTPTWRTHPIRPFRSGPARRCWS